MYSDTPGDADAIAMIYCMVETAKANNIGAFVKSATDRTPTVETDFSLEPTLSFCLVFVSEPEK